MKLAGVPLNYLAIINSNMRPRAEPGKTSPCFQVSDRTSAEVASKHKRGQHALQQRKEKHICLDANLAMLKQAAQTNWYLTWNSWAASTTKTTDPNISLKAAAALSDFSGSVACLSTYCSKLATPPPSRIPSPCFKPRSN